MPYAFLLYVLFVTLSFSVSNCSFFSTSFRFSSLSYLCLFWFRSCSSPASSYSSVPCRRVLQVCLQFRLRLRRVILIPFPLLCLLPLNLLSGFHLFLPFLVIFFLAGFSLRSVCDDLVSLFNNFTYLIITPCWSLL